MLSVMKIIFLFILSVAVCHVVIEAVNLTPNPQYTFEQCLISNPSLSYCVGISALNKLQTIDNDPAYDFVDGVTFIRDEQRPRTLGNYLERDPNDFGGILDTVNHVMSSRMLRWDMSTLYPGLFMRVTPSVDGVLEFAMDPTQEELSLKNLGQFKTLGTARVMTRQFLLPLLLGIKFKVASLIPLFFGLLALLAKKALFISKAALVISSSVALAKLLFGANSYASSSDGYQNHYHGGYTHHVKPQWHLQHGYKTEDTTGDFSDLIYKAYTNLRGSDKIKFSDLDAETHFERNNNEGRNFAWNHSDKDSN